MGDARVEAQTDGGLFIDVPNPVAQTKLHESLVWTRSYYILPLEVKPLSSIVDYFRAPSLFWDSAHHRPNAKPE